jgi:16S rRNA processing protein RimM
MTKGDANKDRLLIGRIGAAHGIKGGVRIATFTGDPLAIASYGPLQTNRPGLTVTIGDARLMKATVIAKLKGITDRNTAETLNGVELYIDRSQLPETEDEDDFYHTDLIGLEARLEDGTVLGEVLDLPNFGAGDLIEIGDKKTGMSELYPFTKAVVPTIAIKDGYLVVVPPEIIEIDDEDEEAE